MIKNIYCIGRNYSAHAAELGNKVESQPVIFSKPITSLARENIIHLPSFSNDIHFETELVVRISKHAYKIRTEEAMHTYDAFAIGLDLTARDVQTHLKERKLPWLLSKGFKDSAYISHFVGKEKLPQNINFEMKLNGSTKQIGNTEKMIFSIDEIISFLSNYIELIPGDVIFTGTPEGVGSLAKGDKIELYMEHDIIAKLDIL
ncbi:fumarylacetoacetate hydrolase family protein [Bartonella sp. DGB1]|uniref:fumarylacetoacetate hydrolase family protein n=1 Tax=Bartonella sp. DGB1 TaxID=3239807 RepID=UPI003524B5B7